MRITIIYICIVCCTYLALLLALVLYVVTLCTLAWKNSFAECRSLNINQSSNIKQIFGRGYPPLYHFILLYLILSITIVTNKHILLKFAPIMPAFCSLLLPSYYSIILPAKLMHPYNSAVGGGILNTSVGENQ